MEILYRSTVHYLFLQKALAVNMQIRYYNMTTKENNIVINNRYNISKKISQMCIFTECQNQKLNQMHYKSNSELNSTA